VYVIEKQKYVKQQRDFIKSYKKDINAKKKSQYLSCQNQ
jgi:hypothetical protein